MWLSIDLAGRACLIVKWRAGIVDGSSQRASRALTSQPDQRDASGTQASVDLQAGGREELFAICFSCLVARALNENTEDPNAISCTGACVVLVEIVLVIGDCFDCCRFFSGAAGQRQCAARSDERRLSARREVHGLQHVAAGVSQCARTLAAGRSLLVSRQWTGRERVRRLRRSAGTRQPAFDHAKVAAALSAAGGKTYDAKHLPFTSFDFSIGWPIHSIQRASQALDVRCARQPLHR